MKLEQRLARLEELMPERKRDPGGPTPMEELMEDLRVVSERLPEKALQDDEYLRKLSGIDLAALAYHRPGPYSELFEQRVKGFAEQPGAVGKVFKPIVEALGL